MELSLICPPQHIEYTSLLPGRFCLADVALANHAYRDYFGTASDDGYEVILDNGVFEGNLIQDKELLELMTVLRPAVLIIPDILNGHTETNYQRALDFLETAVPIRDAQSPKTKFMFVPQCTYPSHCLNTNERNAKRERFWHWLWQAVSNKDISWLGICRDAVFNAFGDITQTQDQEINRFYFGCLFQPGGLETLKISNVKLHYLGVGDDVNMLRYYWYVDSMDTASFFWHGTYYNKMQCGRLPSVLKRPKDYFRRPFTMERSMDEAIKWNCQQAQVMSDQANALRRIINRERV